MITQSFLVVWRGCFCSSSPRSPSRQRPLEVLPSSFVPSPLYPVQPSLVLSLLFPISSGAASPHSWGGSPSRCTKSLPLALFWNVTIDSHVFIYLSSHLLLRGMCWALWLMSAGHYHNCWLHFHSENARSSSEIIVAWKHDKECSSEACSCCEPTCCLLAHNFSFICPNGRTWI